MENWRSGARGGRGVGRQLCVKGVAIKKPSTENSGLQIPG